MRQLHVKCNCDDSGKDFKRQFENHCLRTPNQGLGATKKNSNSISSPGLSSGTWNHYLALYTMDIDLNCIVAPKKRKKIESLRPLAPKISESKGCCSSSKPPSSPSTPTTPIAHVTPEPVSSCCSKKTPTSTVPSTAASPSPAVTARPIIPEDDDPWSSLLPLEPVPLPDIPPPSSCCGPPSKNQQGETIRVVTCRCGDSCACIGCDAHPSRAMKEGRNDVYIGFDTSLNSSKRRLSIATICATPTSNATAKVLAPPPSKQQQQDHPSSILAEDGTVLCGCGCSRAFADCSDCFRELCDGYFNWPCSSNLFNITTTTIAC